MTANGQLLVETVMNELLTDWVEGEVNEKTIID
jgi:hypothetical protein